MVIDFNKDIGNRVSNVKVRCNECSQPIYEDLDLNRYYKIILASFLVTGGDGFTMLSDNLQNHQVGPVDRDIFVNYIKEKSPIEQIIDGRITVVKEHLLAKRNAELYHRL